MQQNSNISSRADIFHSYEKIFFSQIGNTDVTIHLFRRRVFSFRLLFVFCSQRKTKQVEEIEKTITALKNEKNRLLQNIPLKRKDLDDGRVVLYTKHFGAMSITIIFWFVLSV